MDICQIGYDVYEFDSLRGLGIDIIGRVHFDNRDRFAIWMGIFGKATEPCQQTSGCWHLTFDSFLNLDMGDDTNSRNFYCVVYRQHIWLRKWEVIVGGHDWLCWDLWIQDGRGFVGVQRRSCFCQLLVTKCSKLRKVKCMNWSILTWSYDSEIQFCQTHLTRPVSEVKIKYLF